MLLITIFPDIKVYHISIQTRLLIFDFSFQPSGKDPYCFVEFQSRTDAAKALYQMDKRSIMGKVSLTFIISLSTKPLLCVMILSPSIMSISTSA
jgi:hypothetical protein